MRVIFDEPDGFTMRPLCFPLSSQVNAEFTAEFTAEITALCTGCDRPENIGMFVLRMNKRTGKSGLTTCHVAGLLYFFLILLNESTQ